MINTFAMNEECENKMFTLSNNTPLYDMTVDHLSSSTDPFLKAFVKVRITEDLTSLKDVDTPKKKAKYHT